MSVRTSCRRALGALAIAGSFSLHPGVFAVGCILDPGDCGEPRLPDEARARADAARLPTSYRAYDETTSVEFVLEDVVIGSARSYASARAPSPSIVGLLFPAVSALSCADPTLTFDVSAVATLLRRDAQGRSETIIEGVEVAGRYQAFGDYGPEEREDASFWTIQLEDTERAATLDVYVGRLEPETGEFTFSDIYVTALYDDGVSRERRYWQRPS